ncbi:MAG: hypothetical protein M3135_04430 [Actinomycetota bacterium]|nr:hypothetical protein [Actinomycetota bacterium]
MALTRRAPSVGQEERPEPRRHVVAEVLSDGTVRPEGTLGPVEGEQEWSQGEVSGDGWVLWWQRRRLSA